MIRSIMRSTAAETGGPDRPVHSPEAERVVLGSLLLDPSPPMFAAVRETVEADDFFVPIHRKLFAAVCRAHDEGRPVHLELLNDELAGDADFRAAGGAELFVGLIESAPVAANGPAYAREVRRLALRRRFQGYFQEYLRRSLNGEDVAPLGCEAAYDLERLNFACNGPGVTPPTGEAVVVNLDTVTPEPVEWLWPNRFPLGKLSTITGDPSNGKTWLAVYLAACVTRGFPCPDAPEERFPQGSVVFLVAEDDLADTIVPRLQWNGADMSRAVAIQAIDDRLTGGERSFDLGRDIAALEKVVHRQGDTRLVVIDPITAYLGKCDSHNNAEVRAVLKPLTDFAARNRVAVVGINHLNKGNSAAMYRAMGSLALTAVPRAAWCVALDKENPLRRLMLPVKCNLSIDPVGLSFTIIENQVAIDPKPLRITADEALAVEVKKTPESSERKEAKAFLLAALADGPRPASEVEQEACEGAGISRTSLKRARADIQVSAFRPKNPGPWFWELKQSQDKEQRFT